MPESVIQSAGEYLLCEMPQDLKKRTEVINWLMFQMVRVVVHLQK